VRTNAAFLARVADDAAFIAGDIDTGFIERRAETLIPSAEPSDEVVRAAAAALVSDRASDAWSSLVGFRPNAPPCARVDVAVGEHSYWVTADPPPPASTVIIDGERVLFRRGEARSFGAPDSARVIGTAAVSDGAIQSPMPGRIVSVSVRQGQAVIKGQTLISLEAMKMEHSLIAPFDGTVGELAVSVGDQVAENVTLVRIVGDLSARPS